MIRNLKVLGLALVAMLTMGIAASSAMAAVEFHSEATTTNLSGSQEGTNTFVTDSGTIHCTTATFSGTQTGATASAAEVSPTYSGCVSTGFIEANVTVDTNGCKFNLTADQSTMTKETEAVHITGCEAGKPGIVVTAPFCTITVTPQTIGPVDYENKGGEVIVSSTAANITYHESGFACKNGSTSNTTGGTYTGKVRTKGTDEKGKQVSISVL